MRFNAGKTEFAEALFDRGFNDDVEAKDTRILSGPRLSSGVERTFRLLRFREVLIVVVDLLLFGELD